MVFHALTFAEGDVENRGRRPRFSTSPEGPGKRECTGK